MRLQNVKLDKAKMICMPILQISVNSVLGSMLLFQKPDVTLQSLPYNKMEDFDGLILYATPFLCRLSRELGESRVYGPSLCFMWDHDDKKGDDYTRTEGQACFCSTLWKAGGFVLERRYKWLQIGKISHFEIQTPWGKFPLPWTLGYWPKHMMPIPEKQWMRHHIWVLLIWKAHSKLNAQI